LYPNPSAGVFEVSFTNSLFEKCIVTVYNTAGKQVFQQVYNPASEMKINIQNQPIGVYLVSVQTNHGLVVKKVAKFE
jgi:hypothetical protein